MEENRDKQINVNIEKYDGQGPIEVILRQGEPLEVPEIIPAKMYEKVWIDGTIVTPGNYLAKHLGQYRSNDSVLFVSRDDRAIKLVLNASDSYPAMTDGMIPEANPRIQTITGSIDMSKEMKDLHINDETHYWNPQRLAQLLRMNQHIFTDAEKGMKLISDLKNVKAKLNGEYEKTKDSGNGQFTKTEYFQMHVNHNLPGEIGISIALLKGEKKESYGIAFDADFVDGEIRVQIVSPAINEHIEKHVNEMIDVEVARIEQLDPKIVIAEI